MINPDVVQMLQPLETALEGAREAWRPPPRLSLSEWADEHYRLSAESSAQPGRWRTLPYQREIMDAITDPTVTQVSIQKSARIGYTLMISAAIGYYIHQAPAPILLVQPTVDDAKNYSKETIATMLRDVPALSQIVFEDAEDAGPRDSANTILHKRFPGGVLSLVGANSGAGFRRVSRKVVLFDEVDAYPASAGSDGDPIKLGMRRAEYYFDRKIVAGSTPLVAGHSRIEELYESGDQRRYYVPCPHCGHFDQLVFSERKDGGHWLQFNPEDPSDAHFVCSRNGCLIEHQHKRTMIERGEWRALVPFDGHASFRIWAAYSYSPNATWAQIAAEFLEAKRGGRETLRTFVNTVLGETWQESGEAPDWERLYSRRETYAIGTVPEGVKVLTAGVDVQKDRWVYEVVGWGVNRESWSIDTGVIPGDTANEAAWLLLDELLARQYGQHTIRMMAVDSGYNTQTVYNWGRRHERSRVVAVKGTNTARTLISVPSPVDVNTRTGQRIARGYKVWPIGVDVAKGEFYGLLKLERPVEGSLPMGWVHFPEYGPEWFKQITSEHLVTKVKRNGRRVQEWEQLPNRENHWLDARIYARAAAAILGADRLTSGSVVAFAASPAANPLPQAAPKVKRPNGSFLGSRGQGWLSRRR